MGKATIKEDLGDGRYLVDVEYDRRNIDKMIDVLEKTIDDLEYQMLLEIYADDDHWKVTDLKIQTMKKNPSSLKVLPLMRYWRAKAISVNITANGTVSQSIPISIRIP